LARGGVPSEPTKADKSASSASGSLLYSETATAAAKIPFTPRVWEPRWIAAASVFDVGAPAEPPSLPLAEGAAPAGPPELRRRKADNGRRDAVPGTASARRRFGRALLRSASRCRCRRRDALHAIDAT